VFALEQHNQIRFKEKFGDGEGNESCWTQPKYGKVPNSNEQFESILNTVELVQPPPQTSTVMKETLSSDKKNSSKGVEHGKTRRI